MTNEEKAELICMNIEPPYMDFIKRNYDTAMEMAEWKDKQFAEEKKDLRSLVDMLPTNNSSQTIIEDLKALLS